jgi:hypothetical protein
VNTIISNVGLNAREQEVFRAWTEGKSTVDVAKTWERRSKDTPGTEKQIRNIADSTLSQAKKKISKAAREKLPQLGYDVPPQSNKRP